MTKALFTPAEVILIRQALADYSDLLHQATGKSDYRAQVAFSTGVIRGGRKEDDGRPGKESKS